MPTNTELPTQTTSVPTDSSCLLLLLYFLYIDSLLACQDYHHRCLPQTARLFAFPWPPPSHVHLRLLSKGYLLTQWRLCLCPWPASSHPLGYLWREVLLSPG